MRSNARERQGSGPLKYLAKEASCQSTTFLECLLTTDEVQDMIRNAGGERHQGTNSYNIMCYLWLWGCVKRLWESETKINYVFSGAVGMSIRTLGTHERAHALTWSMDGASDGACSTEPLDMLLELLPPGICWDRGCADVVLRVSIL